MMRRDWMAEGLLLYPEGPVMSEWKTIDSAPRRLSRSIGANNYGPRFIGASKGEEPYVCKWWWRDGEEHKCNFITDGGMAAYPEYWQPLPPRPTEKDHG